MGKKFIFALALFFILSMNLAAASVSSDFFQLLNAERIQLGKNLLNVNSQLEQAAVLHATDMANNNYFSHVSLDGTSSSQRIKDAGYTPYLAAGENIAYHSGAPDAEKIYTMWKNSAGHYSNMISSSYLDAGLGVFYTGTKTYYVLDLGKKTTSTIPTVPPTNNVTNSTIEVVNDTNTTSPTEQPSANFTITQYNSTSYKTIKVKAVLSEKSKVYFYTPEKTKKVCNSCLKFSAYFRIPKEENLPVEFNITNKAGQNRSYSFVW